MLYLIMLCYFFRTLDFFGMLLSIVNGQCNHIFRTILINCHS